MSDQALNHQHAEVIARNRTAREATMQEAQRLADQRRAQREQNTNGGN